MGPRQGFYIKVRYDTVKGVLMTTGREMRPINTRLA